MAQNHFKGFLLMGSVCVCVCVCTYLNIYKQKIPWQLSKYFIYDGFIIWGGIAAWDSKFVC